jgi:sulfotransferase famil protein
VTETDRWELARDDFECILLERYRAVYIEIPKVACTSIKAAIADLVGVRLEDFGGNPHAACWPTPGGEPGRRGPPFPGLVSFAFVRNPWDRLVSCYRDKIRGEVDGYTYFTIRPGVANCLARFEAFCAGMTFDDFVRAVASIPDEHADAHFRSQHCFVTGGQGALAVDFVGRYEQLTEDFQRISHILGLPAIELPRLQAARSPASYAAFYTPDTRRIVAERYARDLEMFGHRFDTP